jgi:hypothetical protein
VTGFFVGLAIGALFAGAAVIIALDLRARWRRREVDEWTEQYHRGRPPEDARPRLITRVSIANKSWEI